MKVQCLRMLATLRLEPHKSAIISRFVDTYLRLEADEVRIFDQNVETLPPEERQAVMRITTSRKEEGRQEGIEEGRREGIAEGRQEGIAEGRRYNLDRLRQSLKIALFASFGERASALIDRLPRLEEAALDALLEQLVAGVELNDITCPSD